MRCGTTAPTSSWVIWGSCCHDDRRRGLPRRTMAHPGNQAVPGSAPAERIAVRPVQRPHRHAGKPRRGRAFRPSRDLPQRLLREPSAALRRSGFRLPGGRSVGRRRHQRQADPVARRGRAVRRPLRRPDRPRTGARPACRHAAPDRGMVLAGRQARAHRVDPAGVAGAAGPGRHRVRRRSPRRGRARHRAIRTRRQRRPARPVGRSAGGGAAGQAARAGGPRSERTRGVADAPHPCQRADDGGRDGPPRRGARPVSAQRRRGRRLGPHHRGVRTETR